MNARFVVAISYPPVVRFGLVVMFLACAHMSAPADRDHDGIPDSVDICPDDPEDIDGYEDADGCPDVDCDDCCSTIPQRTIGVRQTAIAERSRATLDHVAAELRSRNDLVRIEIRGPSAGAVAVRDYLLARGVPSGKLSLAEAGGPEVHFRVLESTCLPGG